MLSSGAGLERLWLGMLSREENDAPVEFGGSWCIFPILIPIPIPYVCRSYALSYLSIAIAEDSVASRGNGEVRRTAYRKDRLLLMVGSDLI